MNLLKATQGRAGVERDRGHDSSIDLTITSLYSSAVADSNLRSRFDGMETQADTGRAGWMKDL
jgi:hypothetical protein